MPTLRPAVAEDPRARFRQIARDPFLDANDPNVRTLMAEGGRLPVSPRRLAEINAELAEMNFRNEMRETGW